MDSLAARLLLLAVVAGVAVAAGLLHRRQAGRARAVAGGDRLTAAEVPGLPVPSAARATFVQFSSPACAPCRSVRRVLAGVVAGHPGLAHVEVDATERLDLARRLGILRTPTVLVLDPAGQVVSRVSGPLNARQALDAVPVPLRS
jgi:thiol-disulfide isomerase/thioredoxin